MARTGAHREGHGLYGLLAEFDNPDALLAAAGEAREAGYTELDAYSPHPVHGLAEAIGYRSAGRLATTVLIGGILGCLGGFALQYWSSVIEYPINVGGRPFNSWPAFIPVTFETTILVAALSAVLGMLAWNRLPQPYHPVFNVERFALASRNRFFLCIEAADPRFDPADTRAFLEELGARGVYEVEP